jgi:two-component system, NtrC family, nitrogen regulation response regulator NtrX
MPLPLLLVDDDKSIRATLAEILVFEGYAVEEARDGEEAWQLIKSKDYQVVLCDIKMPRLDGLALLLKAHELKPDLPFIMISAHGTIDTAVEATKRGAFDFIQKPPDLNRLLVSVRNAIERSQLLETTRNLQAQVDRHLEMVGHSPALQKVREAIGKVAPTDARVLITGPNGSGKELVAQAIHHGSGRVGKAFVVVNCAAIPGELIESELFGHEKGSFTSALRQHIGKFEQAHQGTLFLDEIGDMSLAAQAKVLRALQESRISRIGGDQEIAVNVRILAATNKDLKAEISQGRFREDLYHRLSVILIDVPPLNERREDIPLLISRFLDDIAQEQGSLVKKMSPKAVTGLQKRDWSGNIRELRNMVERLVIMSGPLIDEADVRSYGG